MISWQNWKWKQLHLKKKAWLIVVPDEHDAAVDNQEDDRHHNFDPVIDAFESEDKHEGQGTSIGVKLKNTKLKNASSNSLYVLTLGLSAKQGSLAMSTTAVVTMSPAMTRNTRYLNTQL